MILKHNVPDFYFSAFTDLTEDEDSSSLGGPYLWVNSYRPSPSWRRVSWREFLKKQKHDPVSIIDDLLLERLLLLATTYPNIVEKISGSSDLDEDELLSLSFLVLTILSCAEGPTHRKSIGVVDSNQFTWENFERAVSGANAQSKKMRRDLGITVGDLLDHGVHFILNRTNYPFVTCDRAIFVDSWDSLEAKKTFGPLGVLDDNVSGTTERVIYLPLSPDVALVSSAFIKRGYASEPYIECAVEEEVFSLNLLACYGADQIIVSNKDRPFGRFQLKAQSILTS